MISKMSREEEIKYVETMIQEFHKAVDNAAQFGDIDTVNGITAQIYMYRNRLDELKSETK